MQTSKDLFHDAFVRIAAAGDPWQEMTAILGECREHIECLDPADLHQPGSDARVRSGEKPEGGQPQGLGQGRVFHWPCPRATEDPGMTVKKSGRRPADVATPGRQEVWVAIRACQPVFTISELMDASKANRKPALRSPDLHLILLEQQFFGRCHFAQSAVFEFGNFGLKRLGC